MLSIWSWCRWCKISLDLLLLQFSLVGTYGGLNLEKITLKYTHFRLKLIVKLVVVKPKSVLLLSSLTWHAKIRWTEKIVLNMWCSSLLPLYPLTNTYRCILHHDRSGRILFCLDVCCFLETYLWIHVVDFCWLCFFPSSLEFVLDTDSEARWTHADFFDLQLIWTVCAILPFSSRLVRGGGQKNEGNVLPH